MNAFTSAFEWVETRLDEGAWARRLYLVAATYLTWKTLAWSMAFANAWAGKMSGADIALVIGAVSAVVGAVQAFAFKHYLGSREGA